MYGTSWGARRTSTPLPSPRVCFPTSNNRRYYQVGGEDCLLPWDRSGGAPTAVAASGCDEEDLLVEIDVGGGEALGYAMEPAVCTLLAGLGKDDRREGLCRKPKCVANAFRYGIQGHGFCPSPQGLTSGMDPSMVDEYASESKLLQEFVKISSIGKAWIFNSKDVSCDDCTHRCLRSQANLIRTAIDLPLSLVSQITKRLVFLFSPDVLVYGVVAYSVRFPYLL